MHHIKGLNFSLIIKYNLYVKIIVAV